MAEIAAVPGSVENPEATAALQSGALQRSEIHQKTLW